MQFTKGYIEKLIMIKINYIGIFRKLDLHIGKNWRFFCLLETWQVMDDPGEIKKPDSVKAFA